MRWVAEPIPGEDEKSALPDVVNSDRFTMAEPVRNFEMAFAETDGAEEGLSRARRQPLFSGGYALTSTSLGRTERGPAAYPVVTPGTSRDGIYRGMTAHAATAHGAMNTHQDAQCPCDSGLRSCRCCEMDPTFAAPPEVSERADILASRAAKALAIGDPVAAEAASLDVLDVAPRSPSALWTLYQIRRRAGRAQAALALLQRLVTVTPNSIDATQELAMLLFQRGDLAGAEHHARNAVRLAPMHPLSHNLMGMILTEAQRPHIGEFHYRRVLEISGARDPILLANLAWNLKCQGRIAEARVLYNESVEAAPDIFQTLFGWGQLEEADGNFAAARVKLDRAAEIRPDDPGLRVARATLFAREGKLAAALAELGQDPAGNENGASAEARSDSSALLEKGRILDKLGRYDEAFGCFDEAKRLAREITGKHYLDQQAQETAARLRQFFVSDRLRLMPLASVREGSAQPVFILGFPRSGTTLAEQALSGHPRISAGDELPFVNELGDMIPRLFGSPLAYPEALAEFWMGDNRRGPETLRDAYLQKAELRGIHQARQHALHGQDAVERNASRPDLPDLPEIAVDSHSASSARCRSIRVLPPPDPRIFLCLCAGDDSAPLCAGHGPGPSLSGANGAAVPAGSL